VGLICVSLYEHRHMNSTKDKFLLLGSGESLSYSMTEYWDVGIKGVGVVNTFRTLTCYN